MITLWGALGLSNKYTSVDVRGSASGTSDNAVSPFFHLPKDFSNLDTASSTVISPATITDALLEE